MPDPYVSLVIRTKNEEAWIRHCLAMVFAQEGVSFEVIVVDNQSTDRTLDLVEGFPVAATLITKDYSPGSALNFGAAHGSGSHIAFLSAHCVPKDSTWLASLLGGFLDPTIAGVYGRQLPLPFTHPLDRNDLWMSFGEERRVQRKDWFFHNANSMVKRSVWEETPFDEGISNIEDRDWAKKIVNSGFGLVYEPEAAVYHHNGLHRSTDVNRIQKHVEILDKISGDRDESAAFPIPTLEPSETDVVVLLPISESDHAKKGFPHQLKRCLKELETSDFVGTTIGISNLKLPDGLLHLNRDALEITDHDSVEELLTKAAATYEKNNSIPDYYLYVGWDYIHRPKNFFDQLVVAARTHGFDTVFGAEEDFSHHWYFDEASQEYVQLDSSLDRRESRNPVFRAMYGLGTLVSAWGLRSGSLFKGRMGIVSLNQQPMPYRSYGEAIKTVER